MPIIQSHTIIRFDKRLNAPWVDCIIRITTYYRNRRYTSTLHETLWHTAQGKTRTPTFKYAPIYDELAHEMRCWPIELPSCYDDVGDFAFWRYDEYIGRHRKD